MIPLWTQFVEVNQEVKKHFGIAWKPSLYLFTKYTFDIHHPILLKIVSSYKTITMAERWEPDNQVIFVLQEFTQKHL